MANQGWRKKNGAKVRLAARRATLIRQALRQSVSISQVQEDWASAQPNAESMTTEQARQWARTNVRFNSEPLMAALRTLYSESYLLGEDIAMNSISKAKIDKAPTKQQLQRAVGINWDNWKAGNRAAALLVNKPRGLSTLLDNRGVTIQGINRTTMDRIGTRLATALAQGLPPSEVDLSDFFDDSERALAIAQTEMSRAVATASRQLYEESGVELVEWIVADPCDLCQENADVSPIQIGDTFPSGDTEPPAHPNCVCDISPYVVDTRNIGEDALSFILGDED
jgi:hypothetical protein